MEHPELRSEQAYLDRAYEALEQMRASARLLRDSVIGQSSGGTHQARYERDVFVEASLRRLSQLELGQHALCFGRIDHEEEGPRRGDRFYIGRLAVSDTDREPLVVDWRAPASEPFYRATGLDPLGLARRRHFACDGRTLLSIEDEIFSEMDGEGDIPVSGAGALLAALRRSRTGQMRDIVATIQREQDEIIRDDLHGALVVQGGPGTGKTAVLLHRVAYLLFTHRRYLEDRGVLVVGPNQVFLRYIDQVLPALGESGAALTTIAGLRSDVRVTAQEDERLIVVKGDERMARVIERAVKDRGRPLFRDATIPFDPEPLVLTARASRQIVSRAKSMRGTHNRRHRFVEEEVLRRLYSAYASGVKVHGGAGRLARNGFYRAVRREPEFRRTIDRMWPKLQPAELVDDLLISGPLLESAASGILSAKDIARLHRPHDGTLHQAPWTASDVPLVDEAAALLGPVVDTPVLQDRDGQRGGRDAPDDEADADAGFPLYGHIAIDEAQDLSPMQLRMIARRSLSGSLTLVGDLAQSTSHWFTGGWEDILGRLRLPRGTRERELSVNYRTPREVMDLAGRVLARTGTSLRPPRSIRETGEPPRIVRAGSDQLLPAVVEVAERELETIGEGMVAVIAPSRLCNELAASLTGAGLPAGTAGDDGLRSTITVLPMSLAKGLEFDAVVIVDPADLLDEAGGNWRALYVAMTRTTRRLAIVHTRELPLDLS